MYIYSGVRNETLTSTNGVIGASFGSLAPGRFPASHSSTIFCNLSFDAFTVA